MVAIFPWFMGDMPVDRYSTKVGFNCEMSNATIPPNPIYTDSNIRDCLRVERPDRMPKRPLLHLKSEYCKLCAAKLRPRSTSHFYRSECCDPLWQNQSLMRYISICSRGRQLPLNIYRRDLQLIAHTLPSIGYLSSVVSTLIFFGFLTTIISCFLDAEPKNLFGERCYLRFYILYRL